MLGIGYLCNNKSKEYGTNQTTIRFYFRRRNGGIS